MREIIEICETASVIPVLYHGTSRESAENLIKNGWTPRSGTTGGNAGQSRYLYLTNEPENALWFAQEKGEETVISLINVPISFLKVDPEDGTYDTVEEELSKKHGIPGTVVIFKSLGPEHFKICR